jgi:DNA repair exonuclease SbcCD ATPase subunit
MSTDPAKQESVPSSEGPAGTAASTTQGAQTAALTAEQDQELVDMRVVVIESAELATRSANMATNAGANLKEATKTIQSTLKDQNKKTLILFGVTGALLVFGAVIFGTMTFTLKSRLNQLDQMLGAMSKRVGDLNDALEVVASVNEGLQEMVAKQANIASAQTKLEVRINEMLESAANVPELTAKQVDAKSQTLAKQVQSLEGRLQAQASALNSLSGQMSGLKSALGETGGLKREMEALARQQRERQTTEANALAQANQAKSAAEAAAAAAARKRDLMIQYPRAGSEASPTPGAGVLSTKP